MSGGAALEYQVSNADHLQDLAHRFTNVSVAIPLTAGIGIGVDADVFWGKGRSNQDIYGAQIGLSLGGGGGAYVYSTNTWVQQVNGTVPANLLRLAWDALVPTALTVASTVDSILSSAKSQAIVPVSSTAAPPNVGAC